jgi:hypothetical protein
MTRATDRIGFEVARDNIADDPGSMLHGWKLSARIRRLSTKDHHDEPGGRL